MRKLAIISRFIYYTNAIYIQCKHDLRAMRSRFLYVRMAHACKGAEGRESVGGRGLQIEDGLVAHVEKQV